MLARGSIDTELWLSLFCGQVAGWWGLWTAAVAFYCGSADLLNEVWGRVLLPVGKVGNLRALKPKPEPRLDIDVPEVSHHLMAENGKECAV